MFEFGFAVFGIAVVAALLIAFRTQRSLKRRLDRLVLDQNLLADRVLLLTLNRVPAPPTEPSSRKQSSDGRPDRETTEPEIHHLLRVSDDRDH
jgi:hypothetical protein